jgi:YidC/Oxa1 family membrane protein insertase
MGNKTTIIGMATLFLLCMGYWLFLVHYVYPKHPEWDYNGTLNKQAQNSSVSPSPSDNSASGPSTSATTQALGPSTSAGLAVVSTQASTEPVSIGSDSPKDPTYGLGLQVTPQGAGLVSATVNSYKDADAKGLYIFQEQLTDTNYASLATRAVTIDGQTIDLSNAPWVLEPGASTASAAFGVDVSSPDHKPLLHIDKTFQLQERGPAKNRDNTAAGYVFAVNYHLTNLSAHSIKSVTLEFDGPTMPMREMERSDDRQVVAGYDKGNGGSIDLTRDYLAEFKPGVEVKDITSHSGESMLWAGMTSNYFAAIVQPDKAGILGKVEIRCPNTDAVSDEREVGLDCQTAGVALSPGSSADLPMSVFFGPKERDLFEGDFYGTFPREYNQLLVSSSGFCGLCALPWLIDRLVDLLGIFHFVLRDWGLAIIALVVLVRAILHPISKSSQVSMLKLQKMGPELERLKKKYGDDKDALSKAQMEMHKEMGITPFLGCLPMFLQMPIWIALYSALQNDIALRQAPFLWGLTWIHDLARPDRLLTWDAHPFTVPLIGMKLVSLNILPLCVAVVMFLQQKLQPQPPSLTPEQESQQKMMRYMSLAFSLFFYWMPSGLNLYILTSSTIAIFESKIIRKHIKEREEAEKAGKVIVDAKPTRQGKQRLKQEPVAQAKKAGCLGGAWANLQDRAEQIQREAERRKKK